MSEPLYLVYSEPTREWLLPERGGWTRVMRLAGQYTEGRADKAAETMLDGQRHAISLVVVPNLDDRRARCSCGRTEPSSDSLPFFEFRGAGSRTATVHCKCGFTLACHDEAHPHVLRACPEPAPTPRGAMEFDSYYCGCRGWD